MHLGKISGRKKRKSLQGYMTLGTATWGLLICPWHRVSASPLQLSPSLLLTWPACHPALFQSHQSDCTTCSGTPSTSEAMELLCHYKDTSLEAVPHHPQLQLTAVIRSLFCQSPYLATSFPSTDWRPPAKLFEDNLHKTCFCGFQVILYLLSQTDGVTGFLAKILRT